MKQINIREARESLSRLERLLEVEGEVMITRRGQAIARVTRIGTKRPIPSHRDLRETMSRLRRRSEMILREDRNAR